MLHIVSAWVREDGISLGKLKVAEKSNEINAIPDLLESLEISGSVVTIDAMGCQKDIAKKIIEGEANYVLAVKLNHPTLYEEIKEYFDWAREDSIEKKHLDVYKETTFDHGRMVAYTTFVTTDIIWFEGIKDWQALRSFILVERVRTEKNTTSTEQAFFVSSLQADAKYCSHLVRGHWSVENQLHWMLDVAFHEDECAAHTGNAPQNLSLLRKMALACIRKDTSVKASVARKRKIAGWDNAFALRLLQQV
jgi:predicted transposase YbfD/YdcC